MSKEYKHLDDLSEAVKDQEFELQSEKEEMLENKRKLKEIMDMIHIQAIPYMGKDKDD